VKNLEEMFDDMPHQIKPIAEWPNQLKDIAVACFLTDASPQQVFDVISESILDDGELIDIVKSVDSKEIQKDQAYDDIMHRLYIAAQSYIDMEIQFYNEA
jgi:hypothetical protein